MEDGSSKTLDQGNGRGNNTAWVLATVFGVVFLLLIYFLTWFFCFRVVPSFKQSVVELGDRYISRDPDDYLTGLSFMHKGATVDISQIDIHNEGKYEATVCYRDSVFYYEITVKDTEAPDINSKSDDILQYELNMPYYISDFADAIYDESGAYEAKLFLDDTLILEESLSKPEDYAGEGLSDQYDRLKSVENAGEEEYVFFPEQKEYELVLVVTDGSGNETRRGFFIDVKDTLPPMITGYEEEDDKWFATDRLYSVEELVYSVKDNSEFFSTAFLEGDDTLARISFDTPGEHSFTVYAVDESGNEISKVIKANFDEAPVFVGIRDKNVLAGSEYDISKNIIAVDNTDGNVSDGIVIDDGGFDPNVEGVYKVKYTATDSHGLKTVATAELTVGYEETSDYYLTEEELDLLCTYSYFDIDALDEYDYEATVDLVEPTLVNMIYRFGYNGHSAGSGFIYSIDSEYTYITTCAHVVEGLDGEFEMMFSDDNVSAIYMDPPEYEQLSSENEVAMFRFPTSMIPAETLVQLRKVYIDESIYDTLERGEELIAYSGHWMNDEPLIKRVYVKDLDSKFLDDAVNCVKTSHSVEQGMSGTAVFDERGRLVGIVEGYMTFWDFAINDYEREDYQLRIDELDDLYERVSGS